MIDTEHGDEPCRLCAQRQATAATEQVGDQSASAGATLGRNSAELIKRGNRVRVGRRSDDDAALHRQAVSIVTGSSHLMVFLNLSITECTVPMMALVSVLIRFLRGA